MAETRQDQSYGIVPVLRNGDELLLALVQHRAGHWGFPKGHGEPGETPLQSARRELQEELGITEVEIDNGPALEHRYSFERDGIIYDKTVTFWIGYVQDRALKPQEAELRGCRWASSGEVRQLLFADEQKLIDEIERRLAGHGR